MPAYQMTASRSEGQPRIAWLAMAMLYRGPAVL